MNGALGRTNGGAPCRNAYALVQHPGMSSLRMHRGFTLVELMITVIVVGILAAVAFPTYIDQVRKGRRADAFDALVLVQQQQERYRSQNQQYAATFEALKVASNSAAGHYELTLADTSAVGYTVTATPVAGGKQAGDKKCGSFKLLVFKGSQQRTASGDGGVDTTYSCWPQ